MVCGRGQRGCNSRESNHYGGAEWLRGRRKVTTMSQVLSSTAHLLPKDLRFEHRDAKLVSCPERHSVAYLGFPAPGDKASFGAPPTQIFRGIIDAKSELGVKGHRKLTRVQHIVVSDPPPRKLLLTLTSRTWRPDLWILEIINYRRVQILH